MASGYDLRLPQPLDGSNLAKEWPTWKQAFGIFLRATNKIKESEANKIATFLWLIGPRGVEIFNTLYPNSGNIENMFGQDDEQEDNDEERFADATADAQENVSRTLAAVIQAFDEYCLPRRNVTMEAFKFNLITQKEKQPFGEFETELRTQSQFCEFKCSSCQASYADRMLRDKIIIGVHDKKLQLKLLDGKDEPLSKVVETCKIFEAATENRLLLDRKDAGMEIKAIEMTDDTKSKDGIQEVAAISRKKCFNCGHPYVRNHHRSCPAIRVECFACGDVGHFRKCCRKRASKDEQYAKASRTEPRSTSGKAAYSVNWSDAGNVLCSGQVGSARYNDFCVDSQIVPYRVSANVRGPSSHNSRVDRWTKGYLVCGSRVEFKLDTGSDVNCIPINVVRKLNIKVHDFENTPVLDYSGNKIRIYGKVKLSCVDASDKCERVADFLVVGDSFEPLLGLSSCVAFGLVTRLHTIYDFPNCKDEFIKQFHDVFEGLGKIPGKCSIVLKEGSVPTVHYKKRIPQALHDPLRSELQEMEAQGIISPVDYPTDWVSNMQIVEKPNGKLRICLDPKPLNRCIKREHFLIPTQEDLFSRLSGKRVFSVLDLSNGFWQMELDKKSSDLTTFMTPFGRFRWNRVPFGLNNAPEMFQRRMVQIFGDIDGVEIYFDDLAIAGVDEADHDRILAIVLDRARQYNVKFNPNKLQFRSSEIQFMGSIIGEGKVQPLDKDVRAITEMPKPQCVADVTRLLGLLKYLAKYIPNLSRRTANLRKLTHHGAEWLWTSEHDKELDDILSSITKAPVLAIFDPTKPCTIQTDSSKDGLGCVLLQDHGPVAFASRTLSRSEQKWAQIEKELLAVVFACSRFHYFLYGRDFEVQSDHKPLEVLINKDIDEVSSRLQRMFLKLLRYPGMSIVYTAGKYMLVADCLSRAPLPETGGNDVQMEGVVHSLVKRACMSEDNLNLYLNVLKNDERYLRIVQYVEQGWPSYHKLDDLSQMFYRYRHELHYENGLLFKDHRLVIPTKLQSLICKWLHGPHLGIEKTLARARMQFFWPGMTNDITEMVKMCVTCEQFQRNNQKEPLKQDDSPEYPFQSVSTDIYEYGGRNWLVIIDAYSGFICSDSLPDKSMRNVCLLFDKFFNSYGYPTQVRCDNNPFNSMECEQYANKNNIRFTFSSPRYPQSNGLAEKAVAIAKNILKRCYELGEVDQFQYRLLEYNTTPIAGMHLTPSQMFFGRQVKTRLPVDESLLVRKSISEDVIRDKFDRKRAVQKENYDKTAKPLMPLSVGDRVIFKKCSKEWQHGTVTRDVNGRSYIIRDGFGNHFRRNRRFIKRTTNGGSELRDVPVEDHHIEYSHNHEQNQNDPFNLPPAPRHDAVDRPSSSIVRPQLTATNSNGTSETFSRALSPTMASIPNHETIIAPELSQPPSPLQDVSVQDSQVECRTSRSGRPVKTPQRYGEWLY